MNTCITVIPPHIFLISCSQLIFKLTIKNKQQNQEEEKNTKKTQMFHIKSAACGITGEALCGKTWKASNEAQTGCTVLMQTIYFFSVL